jgi:hypothetical protein
MSADALRISLSLQSNRVMMVLGLLFGVAVFLPYHGVVYSQQPADDVSARGSAKSTSLPPSPPSPSNPIQYFRELLAATPVEREALMAGRSQAHQTVLNKSLLVYEGLQPEQREARLRTMELRHHLQLLLRLPKSNQVQRLNRLKLVPVMDRPIVEARLRVWDSFSAREQQELLANEKMMRLLSGGAAGATSRHTAVGHSTSNQVRQIEQQMIRWYSLSPARRVQAQRNFTSLFSLTNNAAAKARLRPLPLGVKERKLMMTTIDRFQKLPASKRELCLENFKKFTALSAPERRHFLVSAQEWRRMQPDDRERWRSMVRRVPPLPPIGPGQPPIPPRVPPPGQ